MVQIPSQPTILLVDDDRFSLIILKTILSANYYPLLANNADEALSMLESRSDISIVLTDYCMPRMHGDELCAIIREQYPDIALVMMSTGESGQVRADAMGISFIQKPYGAENVIATLDSALTKDSMQMVAQTPSLSL
ncbi:MAG: response regulator [Candidatus Kapaibacteriota bacterium]